MCDLNILQRPTVVFINGSLVLGVALISAGLSSGDLPQDVVLHFIVLLLLMLGLLASFNWYVSYTSFIVVDSTAYCWGGALQVCHSNWDSICCAPEEGTRSRRGEIARNMSQTFRNFASHFRRFGSTISSPLTREVKVAVGISGGVDSAVAACLLQKEGYNVTGVFMRNWDEAEEKGNSNCSIEEDFREATKVCESLGIRLLEANFVPRYWDDVFTKFLDKLKMGATPNPDLDCNKYIKFSAFLDFAASRGFDKIATGHYARIVQRSVLGHQPTTVMLQGVDKDKDQTYFLATIDPGVLSNVLFPLGNLTKAEVRSIAESEGLPPASRKSSTGICFIGKRVFDDFISDYIDTIPGRFVDIDTGETMGPCSNILGYTYGQRSKMAGLSNKTYVVGKDIHNRILYVGTGRNHPALYTTKALIGEVHWLSEPHRRKFEKTGSLACQSKARYRQKQAECVLKTGSPLDPVPKESKYWSLEGNQTWVNVLEFEMPAFAITPEQFVVLYDDDICIASASIVSPCETMYEL